MDTPNPYNFNNHNRISDEVDLGFQTMGALNDAFGASKVVMDTTL
jgi:hypothetical protein